MNTSYAEKLPQEWHTVTHVFAALGEPTRQKIIMIFEPGEELAIKDIAAQFPLGRTTVVHHLAVLRANGILTARRKGRETLYSIAYDSVLEAIQKMQMFVEENIWAEIGAKARSESMFGDNFDSDLDIIEETPLLFVSENDDAKKLPQP